MRPVASLFNQLSNLAARVVGIKSVLHASDAPAKGAHLGASDLKLAEKTLAFEQRFGLVVVLFIGSRFDDVVNRLRLLLCLKNKKSGEPES